MTDENSTEIKVFGNDDESLKTLGQLLSNETSRKIIQLLTQEELYTTQISKRLGIQMNTTVFHLKKLVEVGLVTVTHKQIVKKGIDHKYYKMVPNIFVTSTQPKKEVHENGFLKKFFKDGIKFVCIGIVFIGSSIISKNHFKVNEINYPVPFGSDISQTTGNNLEFWIYPLIVLVVALIIERVFFGIKKRKRG